LEKAVSRVRSVAEGVRQIRLPALESPSACPEAPTSSEPVRSIPIPADPDVAARVKKLDLDFGPHGIDRYGTDQEELARFFTGLGWLYHRYFQVHVFGAEHVPARGRAMLVGNHSGGIAVDGAMVLASVFFDKEPPRLAQGMAEKFLARFPFASLVTSRIGQYTGLPRHAAQLLEDERLLMVFPEGTRGTAKLYPERDSLVRFGTGFLRLALETKSPIIPFGFVGAGEAIPTIANLYNLGKVMGLPYVPITPWILPVPRRTEFQLVYGAPMTFDGDGTEEDQVVETWVEQVKARIAGLIKQGRDVREGRLAAEELTLT
jgi:1-acyl-sn-glycerol-3-phosphate acyltransferase